MRPWCPKATPRVVMQVHLLLAPRLNTVRHLLAKFAHRLSAHVLEPVPLGRVPRVVNTAEPLEEAAAP